MKAGIEADFPYFVLSRPESSAGSIFVLDARRFRYQKELELKSENFYYAVMRSRLKFQRDGEKSLWD